MVNSNVAAGGTLTDVSKIDNKDRYAFNRCIEEMYKDMPYSLYKYGNI